MYQSLALHLKKESDPEAVAVKMSLNHQRAKQEKL